MLSEALPWILQIDAAGLKEMQQPCLRRMFELIQRERDLITAIVALKGRWQHATLIHGDAKLDNVLVAMGAVHESGWWTGLSAASEIPLGTSAQSMHSCLIVWLHGIHFSREQPFDDALEGAIIPLSLVQAFLAAFISAYGRAEAALITAARGLLFAVRSNVREPPSFKPPWLPRGRKGKSFPGTWP